MKMTGLCFCALMTVVVLCGTHVRAEENEVRTAGDGAAPDFLQALRLTPLAEQQDLRNALSRCPGFVAKYRRGEDVEIVLLGDSLFAQASASVPNANPENLPPGMQRKHVAYYLWKMIGGPNKPQYDRYDSMLCPFNESDSGWKNDERQWNAPSWSGEYRSANGSSLTRHAHQPHASVRFRWDLAAHEKLNFIYRKSTDGVDSAVIDIAEGNGMVEWWNGSDWMEARGATFSMRLPPAPRRQGHSHHLANWKLKMRRRDGGSGEVTVTIGKGDDDGRFYYWGTERWSGGAVFIGNVARGGRTLRLLSDNWNNDVFGRQPDLVLLQLPLINMYSEERNLGSDFLIDSVRDHVFGDRAGHENSRSFQALSAGFTRPEVLLIVPHYRQQHLDGNTWRNTFRDMPVARTAFDAWQAVKEMIAAQNRVNVIDMSDVFLREAEARGWTYEQAVTGSSDASPDSFTKDTVHTNRLGAWLYARYISLAFAPNSR